MANGTFKPYQGYTAARYKMPSGYTSGASAVGIGTVTTTDNSTYSLLFVSNYNNLNPLKASAATAYSGTYDNTDYTKVDEATTTLVSSTYNSTNCTWVNVVSITATSNITLTAIKFYSTFSYKSGTSTYNKETLSYGYFFDTPIQMVSGETKTFTIVLS